jgi:ABC-type arginine transport system permease subunit
MHDCFLFGLVIDIISNLYLIVLRKTKIIINILLFYQILKFSSVASSSSALSFLLVLAGAYIFLSLQLAITSIKSSGIPMNILNNYPHAPNIE